MVKKVFTDGISVIDAAFLNSFQDEVIAAQAITEQAHLFACDQVQYTYGGRKREGTEMPTTSTEVWSAVNLLCAGDASPRVGDIIVGSNGYCAAFGGVSGAYTLTGTGVTVAPVPDNDVVRYSAQSKTTAEQAQARQNINAADGGILNPFGEALSGFADGDVTGLPVVDPDAETGYIAATVSRAATEQAGQAVSIPTTGYLAAAIAAEIGEAIGGAY